MKKKDLAKLNDAQKRELLAKLLKDKNKIQSQDLSQLDEAQKRKLVANLLQEQGKKPSPASAISLPEPAPAPAPAPAKECRADEKLDIDQLPPINVVARNSELQLSFRQQRLWFLEKLHAGQAVFHISFALSLRGELNIGALQSALKLLINRHESLRTRFLQQSGKTHQIIELSSDWDLSTCDLSEFHNDKKASETARLKHESATAPFDLESGPLLRTNLLHLNTNEHVLLLAMHQTIMDEWSIDIFLSDLVALYSATAQEKAPALPELPVQYADFACWQRNNIQSGILKSALEYWQNQLHSIPDLTFPTDYSRQSIQAYAGSKVTRYLSVHQRDAVKAFAETHDTTSFMTLLAVFQIILSRHTGQSDFGIGTAVNNRTIIDLQGLIGTCSNTLVLRLQTAPTANFVDILQHVWNTTQAAYKYQDIPFEYLLDNLPIKRNLKRTPLFQVFCHMLNPPNCKIDGEPLDVEFSFNSEANSVFDMNLCFIEDSNGLKLDLIYNTELFVPERMEELLAQCDLLLSQVLAHPEKNIFEHSLVNNDSSIIDPAIKFATTFEESICAQFSQQAQQNPARIAIIDADESWSYRAIDDSSSRLANALQTNGVKTGDIVAIYADRSASFVWALLAVIKSGATIMVIDSSSASAWMLTCINRCHPNALLMVESAGLPPVAVAKAIADIKLKCNLVIPKRSQAIKQSFLNNFSIKNPSINANADDVAAINFIADKDGSAIAVQSTHRSFGHFLLWYRNHFDLNENDHVAMLSQASHNTALRDILVSLGLGAKLVMPEASDLITGDSLLSWMLQESITVSYLAPSMTTTLAHWFDIHPNTEAATSLRYLFCSDNLLTWRSALALQQLTPTATLVNFYSVIVEPQAMGYFIIPKDTLAKPRLCSLDSVLPLGKGVDDIQLLNLTNSMKLTGVGEIGEIFIRSKFLATSYFANSATSNERFIKNPFTDDKNDILYRTGDSARYLPDGTLSLLDDCEKNIAPQLIRSEHKSHQTSYARTDMEFALTEIWMNLLNIDTLSVHDDFFDLGGHSLLVVQMISTIRRQLLINVPLSIPFEMPTLSALANTIESLQRDTTIKFHQLSKTDYEQPIQLSPLQQRIWLLCELERNHSVTNIIMAIRIHGALNKSALRHALKSIVTRHESLRTTFTINNNKLVQEIADWAPVSLDERNLLELPNDAREATMQSLITQEVALEFDLERGPLFRITLYLLADNEQAILLTLHPIIADDWSARIFMYELVAFYQAVQQDNTVLPALEFQYKDFCLWQCEWLRNDNPTIQIDYWLNQLKGTSVLFPAVVADASPTLHGNVQCYRFSLDTTKLTSLRQFSHDNDHTLFTLLFTSYQLLLSLLTAKQDICIGIPDAGRYNVALNYLIGAFANTQVLRGNIEEIASIEALLTQNRETVIAAYRHKELPYAVLLRLLQQKYDLQSQPLVQAGFALTKLTVESFALPGIAHTPIDVEKPGINYEINWILTEANDVLTGVVEYNADLFDIAVITSMVTHFEVIVDWIVTDIDSAVSACPISTDAYKSFRNSILSSHAVDNAEQETVFDNPVTLAKEQPKTRSQIILQEQWQHILQLDEIGTMDNFFSLGGNSLLALEAVCAIRNHSGIDLPLHVLFDTPFIANIARWIETEERCISGGQLPPLKAIVQDQNMPLSFEQERRWFLHQLDANIQLFSCCSAMHLYGTVDAMVMRSATASLVQSHDILRTNFITVGGEARQIIHTRTTVDFSVIDNTTDNKDERNKKVKQTAYDEARHPFELETGPLLRTRLIVFDEQHATLLLVLHRIIADDISAEILTRQLITIYSEEILGTPTTLQPSAVRFADFAYWQRNWLDGEILQTKIDYWRSRLEGVDKHLTLSTNRLDTSNYQQKIAASHNSSAHQTFIIQSELLASIRQFSKKHDVTLFVILLTAFQLLLARYSGQQRFCISAPVSGRVQPETKNIIGVLANELLLRADLAENPSVAQLLLRVRDDTVGALAHQDLPIALLLTVLQDERQSPYEAIAQVAFELKSSFAELPQPNGLNVEPLAIDAGEAKYDLSLSLSETDDILTGTIIYNIEVLDDPTTTLMAEHYCRLLELVITQPECAIENIALVADANLHTMLNIDTQDVNRIFQLTTTQRDLNLSAQTSRNNTINSHGVTLEIDNEVDSLIWQQAIQRLCDNQQMLRSRLVCSNVPFTDAAYLAVLSEYVVTLDFEDLSNNQISEDALAVRIQRYIYRDYDLSQDASIHHLLIKLSPKLFLAVIACNQIMLDAQALNEYLISICRIYEDISQGVNEHDIADDFGDYIDYNRTHFDNNDILQYWRKHFHNLEPLVFPISGGQGEFVQKQCSIDESHWNAVKHYCDTNGITPTVYFKSLYGLALKVYCQPLADFVIFENNYVRPDSNTRPPGCYYHQIPFVFYRNVFDGKNEIIHLFAFTLDYQKHLVGLENISVLQQHRLLQSSDMNFLYHFSLSANVVEFQSQSAIIQEFAAPPLHGDVRFLVKTADSLVQLNLDYHNDVFQENDFLQRLVFFSHQIIDGAKYFSDLSWVTNEEQQYLLAKWNSTQVDYPRSACLHGLFETQALISPQAIAIEYADRYMSYGELNDRSNQLACYLRSFGISANVRVGLCVNPSFELIIGLLGILKSGGAYILLDPTQSRDRINAIVTDAQAPLVLTEERLFNHLSAEETVICLDKDWDEISRVPCIQKEGAWDMEYLAYVTYSTNIAGQPHGVCVSHKNIINLLRWYIREFDINENDKVLVISSTLTDLVQKSFFALLTVGGTIVLPNLVSHEVDSIADQIDSHGITVINCAPSSFYPIVQQAQSWPLMKCLRYLFLGGELVNLRRFEGWLRHNDCHCLIVNTYNSAECTDIASFYRITDPISHINSTIPIGRPIDNVRLYVLDRDRKLVPVGVTGELCIAGHSVSIGYSGNIELTDRRFEFSPYYIGAVADRLFHSGDLVRYLPGGNLIYVGRHDSQVKLRGMRVELNEIEYGLNRQSAIRESVVTVHNEELVAYVVLHDGEQLTLADLRHRLKNTLPDYMIPTSLVTLNRIPRFANARINRKALPEPSLEAKIYVAPRTQAEQELAKLWQEVLNLSPIGVHDNFFELGGNSILAVRLMSLIKQQFLTTVSLKSLFQGPTIEDLAAVIVTRDVEPKPPLIAIQPSGTNLPIFCIHALNGHANHFVSLSRRLGESQPLYALESIGLQQGLEPQKDIKTMAASYIDAILTVQSHGPYILAGHAFGSLIAFEMACALTAKGEDVKYLLLFESMSPASIQTQFDTNIYEATWLNDMLKLVKNRLHKGHDLIPTLSATMPLEQQLEDILQSIRASTKYNENAARVIAVCLANYRAMREYRTEITYTGSSVLFRAHISAGHTEGWDASIPANLLIKDTPGDCTSLLLEPNVAVLARTIKEIMESGAD